MANSKPTIKEIEEYMASLKIEEDYYKGFNGMTNKDIYDAVNKPKHYMLMPKIGVEVRDVIEALVEKFYEADPQKQPSESSPLFISDYVQLMQYLMRFMDKNGVEDLKKARWYLDKMIESY
jgi:hypothetical protein